MNLIFVLLDGLQTGLEIPGEELSAKGPGDYHAGTLLKHVASAALLEPVGEGSCCCVLYKGHVSRFLKSLFKAPLF